MKKWPVFVLLFLGITCPSAAATFEFLPGVACKVLEIENAPDGSVVRFRVSPAGPFGAWQGFAQIVPPDGPAYLVFQNGASSCGIIQGSAGVQLSVTVVQPDRVGHLTLWPDGHQVPGVSQMNTYPGISLSEEITVQTCQLATCPYDVALFTVASLERLRIDVTGYLVH